MEVVNAGEHVNLINSISFMRATTKLVLLISDAYETAPHTVDIP